MTLQQQEQQQQQQHRLTSLYSWRMNPSTNRHPRTRRRQQQQQQRSSLNNYNNKYDPPFKLRVVVMMIAIMTIVMMMGLILWIHHHLQMMTTTTTTMTFRYKQQQQEQEQEHELQQLRQQRQQLQQHQNNNKTPRITATTPTPTPPPLRLQQLQGGDAFVHIGKTGGSTLSVLLRNGCHSWIPHPCRTIDKEEESLASQSIVSYYHVADFGLLPQSQHDVYVVTVRDPLDRTISAFTYGHYDNIEARNETHDLIPLKLRRRYQQACQICFPTLEDFAQLLITTTKRTTKRTRTTNNTTTTQEDDDKKKENDVRDDEYYDDMTFSYPYRRNVLNYDSCQDLARAMLHGRVRTFPHLYFNYQKIHSLLLLEEDKNDKNNDDNNGSNKNNDDNKNKNNNSNGNNGTNGTTTQQQQQPRQRLILVTRLEHLWQDWMTVNEYLGRRNHTITEESITPTTTTTTQEHGKNDKHDQSPPPTQHDQQQQQQHYYHQQQQYHHIRNTATLDLPVTRHLSVKGHDSLCRALQWEYIAYFQLLIQAQNLQTLDFIQSIMLAQQHCPTFWIDFATLLATKNKQTNKNKQQH